MRVRCVLLRCQDRPEERDFLRAQCAVALLLLAAPFKIDERIGRGPGEAYLRSRLICLRGSAPAALGGGTCADLPRHHRYFVNPECQRWNLRSTPMSPQGERARKKMRGLSRLGLAPADGAFSGEACPDLIGGGRRFVAPPRYGYLQYFFGFITIYVSDLRLAGS